MVAFLSPILVALLALVVALVVALRRIPRVARVVVPPSAPSASNGLRLAVAGSGDAGALAQLGEPGQAVLGVGHRVGSFRTRIDLDGLLAWAAAHPGGLVVLHLPRLDGRMALESDVALLRRVARRLGSAPVDVVVTTRGRLARLAGAAVWPWSVRDTALRPLVGDGHPLRQLLRGEASRAALMLRGRLDRLAALAAIFVFAGVATAPAWLGSGDELLGSEAGSMPAQVWLAAQVVGWFETGGDLLHSDALFWPGGSVLLRHTSSVLAPLLAAPFIGLWGIDGWNPFVFVLTGLAGVTTFRLARALDVAVGAAVVAAAAVVLGPPALDQLGQARPGLLCFFVFPLAVERLVVAVDSTRPRDGWLAAGAVLLALLGSWMLGVLALAVGALLFLERTVRDPRPRGAQLIRIGRALAFAVVAAVPLIAQAVSGELLGLTWGELPHELDDSPRSALVVDELVRNAWRPGQTWAGALGLVAVGVAWARRPDVARPLAVLAAGMGLAAIGPWFAPAEGWSMAYTEAPWSLAHAWVPLASLLHHPADLLLPMALIVGLLGAVGLDRLVRRSSAQLGLGLAAVALAFLGAEPVRTTAVDRGAVELMGLLPEQGAVAYLPVGLEGPYLLAAAAEGRALLGGPGARAGVLDQGGLWTQMMRDPGLAVLLDGRHAPPPPEAWAPLAEKGLRYVVVDNALIHQLDAVGAPEAEAASGLPLLIQASLGQPLLSARTVTVYRVPSP